MGERSQAMAALIAASRRNASALLTVKSRKWRDLTEAVCLRSVSVEFQGNPMATVLLLSASNILMTFAWYWHLKHKDWPLWQVVLISWGIAFFEYTLAVPANRIGHGLFTAPQLKVIQEVIALAVFAVFSVGYLKEPLSWNHAVGFALIAALMIVVLYNDVISNVLLIRRG